MKIAGNLTVKDWRELEKKLDINLDEFWNEAFHFFEVRIRTRYLKPIQAILDMNLNEGEGFSVVNLQCSLIETIESFLNGWVYYNDGIKGSPKGWFNKIVSNNNLLNFNNQKIFESFFQKHPSFKKIDGNSFYLFVRCALLHETQTKNNWKIKKGIEGGDFFKELNGDNIIYRDNFQKELENLIKRYKTAIISGQDFDGILAKDLRENFKAKFNHICNNS